MRFLYKHKTYYFVSINISSALTNLFWMLFFESDFCGGALRDLAENMMMGIAGEV
jgi:hypothetical protein